MISGGERQLALLARALAQEPQFIVLDEPTASLDFGNQGKVMREIRALAASGHGVLFTTHDPNHAMRAADRAFLLREGTRIAEGPVGAGAQPRAARGALRRAGRDRHRHRGGYQRVSAGLGIGMATQVMVQARQGGDVLRRSSGRQTRGRYTATPSARKRFVRRKADENPRFRIEALA